MYGLPFVPIGCKGNGAQFTRSSWTTLRPTFGVIRDYARWRLLMLPWIG